MLLTALLLLASSAAVAADDPEGWAYQIAKELMSPFCPGRTLADCPSSHAETLRTWIIVQEAAGRSRADVEEELYERYGEVMRPAPRAEGLGLAAYLAPSLMFLFGGGVVAVYLRLNRRKTDAPRAEAAGARDPELERIIDEELAR
ncbi:MAG: cytochrome c-type biogenesis protein CcmH [Myxococcales bacterium]|nr:cytochrome c-type biogenesis protein CcmH [Myxococcales bacterium]MDH5306296.1 cytochrome c-type biogenesis protein CcmH [Myxococcales bacterium]